LDFERTHLLPDLDLDPDQGCKVQECSDGNRVVFDRHSPTSRGSIRQWGVVFMPEAESPSKISVTPATTPNESM
jgi:hypothetical protein